MTTTLNASTSAGLIMTPDTSGILQLQTANTTAMTIDGSQNVGIGVSPTSGARTPSLQVGGGGTFRSENYNGSTNNQIKLIGNGYEASDTSYKYLVSANASMYVQTNGVHAWHNAPSGTAGNVITFTQAMTLDSSGNLLVGRTSTSTLPGGSSTAYFQNGASVTNGTNTANYQLDRINFNAGQFYVLNGSSTGVILTSGSTAWAAQSDERTKDIIEPINDAVRKVSNLRAVIGKYKTDEDGIRRSFLIAQDVQAVLPEAVSESDDEQGTLNLRYSEVIPLLTAAIQELKAELDEVKAQLKGAQA